MRFISERLKDIPTYLFSAQRARLRELAEKGIDVISLAVGDPVEPTPSHIIDAANQALMDPANHRYPDPDRRGMPEFRNAVASWYARRNNVKLDPESEVLCLNGSKEGIHYAVMALVNEGDAVLITNPGYPGHRVNILLAGAVPYDVPILERNGYIPDIEGIPEDLCRKAKLFFLNYPNNPTGACADEGFFKSLVSWAKKYDIILVNDNPYSEFVYEDGVKISMLKVPGAKDIGIEFNSLSKAYNMTGWRIGMAVGNREIIEAMSRFQQNVSSGVFNVLQFAGKKALDDGDPDIDSMLSVYSARRKMALAELENAGIQHVKSTGTLYLWAPVPDGFKSEEFSTYLLENAHVLITPGTAYGRYGEGYFRISLTVSDDNLTEAFRRIRQALKK